MKRKVFILCFGIILSSQSLSAEVLKVASALPAYQKTEENLAGSLNSVGSDTMNNLMALWGESFRKLYPAVQIQVEGKGSGTAPPALIAGTADLGPMSREMKIIEVESIEKKFGAKPVQLRVALDALAVFVHKDNSLKNVTLEELDAIFGRLRKREHPKDILVWGELGLKGIWKAKPINLYGRNSASGTYSFFKEHVMKGGDFKDTVKEQPGSASVVQGVTEDRFALGYSGIGYKTSGVKILDLAEKKGAPVKADYENVLKGKYPLARHLNIYIVKDPKKPFSPLLREFLLFVLSKEGQEIVIKDGYLPLQAKFAKEEFKKLGEVKSVSTSIKE